MGPERTVRRVAEAQTGNAHDAHAGGVPVRGFEQIERVARSEHDDRVAFAQRRDDRANARRMTAPFTGRTVDRPE